MPRVDGRKNHEARPINITPGVSPYAEGSALCAFGNTQVLCTASVEDGVPRFLEGRGQGWITAEYAMLPRATHTRTARDHQKEGRAREISRLIGRSLRGAADLDLLDGRTMRIDCDVMVADGGTRTAAITGGWVALALALQTLGQEPVVQLAAISVGKLRGEVLVDLCFEEDSMAQVDANLVIADGGRLVEVQATAEKGFFGPGELAIMVELGQVACRKIFGLQRAALDGGG